MDFSDGIGHLDGWVKVDPPNAGNLDVTQGPEGKPALHIATSTDTSASWRAKAVLPKGHYRFEGKAKIAAVKPLAYGNCQGAGLRVTGNLRQTDDFVGDSPWRELHASFVVDAGSEVVEFVCELRASAGEAWFDIDSLRVVALPEPLPKDNP